MIVLLLLLLLLKRPLNDNPKYLTVIHVVKITIIIIIIIIAHLSSCICYPIPSSSSIRRFHNHHHSYSSISAILHSNNSNNIRRWHCTTPTTTTGRENIIIQPYYSTTGTTTTTCSRRISYRFNNNVIQHDPLRKRSTVWMGSSTSNTITSATSTSIIPSIVIATILLLSSMVGIWIEHIQQQEQDHHKSIVQIINDNDNTTNNNNNSGRWKKIIVVLPSIIVTLGIATIMVSILRQQQNVVILSFFQHSIQNLPMFNYCWSTILPLSLALLLLASSSSSSSVSMPQSSTSMPQMNNTTTTQWKDNDSNSNPTQNLVRNNIMNTQFMSIQRLGVPFIIASLGSIIGCLLSFFISYYYFQLSKQQDSVVQLFVLSITDASQAAACLCASFIGGSVNFLATANIITKMNQNLLTNNNNNSALLSAMSAVDIIVMAIYFTILSTAMQSKRLARWFNNNNIDTRENQEQIQIRKNSDNNEFDTIVEIYKEVDSCSTGDATMSSPQYIVLPAVVMVGSITLLMVEISKRLEDMISRFVPGTACTFLAIIVPLFTNQMNHLIHYQSKSRHYLQRIWKAMQICAEPMSRVAFLLVFATMGCTMDVSTAIQNGPACLVFSLLALFIHGIITLFGSLLWHRLRSNKDCRTMITLTDVLIASNAAIGGPATAAAFCNQIKTDPTSISLVLYKRHLIIAATVWGVVGYAIGTSIGVSMYRILVHTFIR